MQETQETYVGSLGWEDLLEEGMATHSGILAWQIPWTEEPDGLQSVDHKESDRTEELTLSLSHKSRSSQVALVVNNPPANA